MTDVDSLGRQLVKSAWVLLELKVEAEDLTNVWFSSTVTQSVVKLVKVQPSLIMVSWLHESFFNRVASILDTGWGEGNLAKTGHQNVKVLFHG